MLAQVSHLHLKDRRLESAVIRNSFRSNSVIAKDCKARAGDARNAKRSVATAGPDLIAPRNASQNRKHSGAIDGVRDEVPPIRWPRAAGVLRRDFGKNRGATGRSRGRSVIYESCRQC